MRTIFVETFNLKATNFDITTKEQEQLFASGQKAAKVFLKTWNYKEYLKICKLKP
ncbi:MAG TPA: hypothetical protein VJ836_03125 [Candidatus Saccharimonadales bacterium]|nr:hypothetical protein [Candidatus Saccharimonadales bacterium]